MAINIRSSIIAAAPYHDFLSALLSPPLTTPHPQLITHHLNGHPLRSLELSLDGSLLATSSVKGTLITTHSLIITHQSYGSHSHPPRSLELSLDGSLLATSSVKGTLIRVFRTATGECLHELRRGAEQASIYSLAISPQVRGVRGGGGGAGDGGVGCPNVT